MGAQLNDRNSHKIDDNYYSCTAKLNRKDCFACAKVACGWDGNIKKH